MNIAGNQKRIRENNVKRLLNTMISFSGDEHIGEGVVNKGSYLNGKSQQGASVSQLGWRKNKAPLKKSVLRKELYSSKGVAGNKVALEAVLHEAAKKNKDQKKYDEAVALCRKTDDRNFKQCIEELERLVLSKYTRFATELQKQSMQEQTLMRDQRKLMQRELFNFTGKLN